MDWDDVQARATEGCGLSEKTRQTFCKGARQSAEDLVTKIAKQIRSGTTWRFLRVFETSGIKTDPLFYDLVRSEPYLASKGRVRITLDK